MEAKAEARYIRISPQKARLVVDLIRGRKANDARHHAAPDQQADRAGGARRCCIRPSPTRRTGTKTWMWIELFVTEAYVNEGPRQKRVRPAPMGRAYRYQRRTSHIVVVVSDKAGAATPATNQENA